MSENVGTYLYNTFLPQTERVTGSRNLRMRISDSASQFSYAITYYLDQSTPFQWDDARGELEPSSKEDCRRGIHMIIA